MKKLVLTEVEIKNAYRAVRKVLDETYPPTERSAKITRENHAALHSLKDKIEKEMWK